MYSNDNELKPNGSMEFTPDEVEAGYLDKFIHLLMDMKNEFRVWTDGYCWIVDYISDITVECGIRYELTDLTSEDDEGDWREAESDTEEDYDDPNSEYQKEKAKHTADLPW